MSAEALMRSRYSAFTKCAFDYLVATHHPDMRDELDEDALRAWAESAEWLGLEILSTEAGEPTDTGGFVEFVARYRTDGAKVEHRERSRFQQDGGVWYYVEGYDLPAPQTAKIGRNEPCPCGSGKKYKKCCGR